MSIRDAGFAPVGPTTRAPLRTVIGGIGFARIHIRDPPGRFRALRREHCWMQSCMMNLRGNARLATDWRSWS
jgi:hypothetical protein